MSPFWKRKQDRPAASVTLEPYPLRTGTEVAMVDIDPAFIERGRTGPRVSRRGHKYAVALFAVASDVLVLDDGEQVARLDPQYAQYYLAELTRLQHQGRIGTTVAYIRPAEWKSQDHSVSLNWSENALGGGGIL